MYLDHTSRPLCSARAVLESSPPSSCVMVGRGDSGQRCSRQKCAGFVDMNTAWFELCVRVVKAGHGSKV